MSSSAKERAAYAARLRWGNYEERFWSNVKRRGPDECWEWQGLCQDNGYGIVHHGGHRLAHRLAYKYTKGDPTGLVVRHSCDNPPCCNPKHLLLGTHLDNAMDKVSRGRASGGPRNGQHGAKNNAAKVTELQALRVLDLYKSGIKQATIARITGVTKGNVWNIVHRKSWSCLG